MSISDYDGFVFSILILLVENARFRIDKNCLQKHYRLCFYRFDVRKRSIYCFHFFSEAKENLENLENLFKTFSQTVRFHSKRLTKEEFLVPLFPQ